MQEAAPLVLVADDNPDILRLVSGRLRKHGYDVVTAANGDEALATLSDRRPAVAVLDWMMPGLTGPEVCARAKQAPKTAGVAVILLTARAADADVLAGTDCGADAYVIKPFETAELVEQVRRFSAPGSAA